MLFPIQREVNRKCLMSIESTSCTFVRLHGTHVHLAMIASMGLDGVITFRSHVTDVTHDALYCETFTILKQLLISYHEPG